MTTASGSSVSLGCFLGIGGDNKEKAGQGGKKVGDSYKGELTLKMSIDQ